MKAMTNTQQQLLRTANEIPAPVIGGDNDPILDWQQLDDDMHGDSDQLQCAAWHLGAELKMLVDLRCEAERVTCDEAWKYVLNRKRLQYDIDGPECERRRTALRVLAEIAQWKKMRAVECGERPPLTKSEAALFVLRSRYTLRRLQQWETMAVMTN